MTFVSKTGRPPRGTTFKELFYAEPIEHRQDIVRTGIREARAGNVRWAQWLAQISGEWTGVQVQVAVDSPFAIAIDQLRAAIGNEPMFGTGVLGPGADAVDAEAHVVSEDPSASEG